MRLFSSLRLNSGSIVLVRSKKSLIAGNWRRSSFFGSRARSGSASGGTKKGDSPEMRRTARLVTRILTPEQAPRRLGSAGAASSTCSKLSSNRSRCFSLRNAFKCSSTGRLPNSCNPSVFAIAGTTSSGSLTSVSETKHT